MIEAILLTFDNEDSKSKLEYIYMTHGEQMYSTAYSILKSREDAEDAVHDTFLKLSRVIDSIDTENKNRCKAYVLTAVRSTAYTLIQKKKHNSTVISEDGDTDVADEESDVLIISISNETVSSVSECIASLDVKYRDVLYYAIVEEMKDKEISKITGIKSSTVRTRIMRGKKLLIEKLTERGIICNGTIQ